jgi:hypothetical protein
VMIGGMGRCIRKSGVRNTTSSSNESDASSWGRKVDHTG